MKRNIALSLGIVVVLAPLALAHVTVQPRESKLATEERYTERVPTHGPVATAFVQIEIPDGVAVLEVEATDGATSETQKQGARIVGITWTKEIPPEEVSEFFFRARSPASGAEISWKTHQHLVDGTVVDWVGPPDDPRPAATTKLQ